MKKFTLLCLSVLCALSLAACGSDSSDVSVTSSGKLNSSMNGSSVDEDDLSARLTADDAYQLVSEKTRELSISANDTVTVDGRTYYLYIIQDSVSGITCNYAVDDQSGEVSVYTEEGTIQSLSSSPFFEAELDAECDWSGSFTMDSLTITLMQGDPQSFEFSLAEDGDMVWLTGVAYVHGNIARFQDDEAGIALDFVLDETAHTLTVSGHETYAGTYKLSA